MAEAFLHLDTTDRLDVVVSQGYRRSRRIEAAIAGALGTTPYELYPERYSEREDDSTP